LAFNKIKTTKDREAYRKRLRDYRVTDTFGGATGYSERDSFREQISTNDDVSPTVPTSASLPPAPPVYTAPVPEVTPKKGVTIIEIVYSAVVGLLIAAIAWGFSSLYNLNGEVKSNKQSITNIDKNIEQINKTLQQNNTSYMSEMHLLESKLTRRIEKIEDRLKK
jgi:hypothetical protein